MSSFLIANQSVGLQKDLRPWLLPDDAYVDLENAYIFRGRTTKKGGSRKLGTLSFVPVNIAVPFVYPFAIAPALAVGVNTYILPALIPSAPVMNGVVPSSLMVSLSIGPTTLTDNGNGTMRYSGANLLAATINYTTGTLTITLPALSPLSGAIVSIVAVKTWPPMRTPCMGIWLRENPEINFEQTVFFDQTRSYIFTAGGFQQLGTQVWTGSDSQFFWCINTRNPLLGNTAITNNNFFLETNFNPADGMYYLDSTNTWTLFNPVFIAGPPKQRLISARCIVAFKNRLLFFNTWEQDTAGTAVNYPNRLRFSWIGDPIGTPPDFTPGYIQSPAGKGGFIDAAIAQQIVSVAVLKDCILVKFEEVSWRVVYTGNPYQPFEWQKVNQEFGSESTFSSIQFDDFVLTVGDRAITQDTSLGVRRIDDKVPDEVFEITNDNEGPKRVIGIRDFPLEQVYWTIPLPTPDDETPYFPNRILNYSYRTNAYSVFKDSYTFLGRFQNQTYYTWGDAPFTWGDADFTWGSPEQDFGFNNIATGNQQGNIFLYQLKTENDAAYEINAISVAPGGITTVTVTARHNLDDGDFVKFYNVQGIDVVNTPVVAILPSGSTSYMTTLSQVISALNPMPGFIIPGSVNPTIVQTMPALTVTFSDQGDGSLLGSVAGWSGTVDYETGVVVLTFPAVPGPLNISTLTLPANASMLNGRIFAVLNVTDTTFDLGGVNSSDLLVPVSLATPANPFVFGQMAYLTNFNISTKQFNPFAKDAKTLNMPYADLYLDGTDNGAAQVQVYTNDFTVNMNTPLQTNVGAQWTFSTATTGEERFWTRIFTNARGEFVQMVFLMSNAQMVNNLSENEFTIHGLMPNFNQSGRIIRTKYV